MLNAETNHEAFVIPASNVGHRPLSDQPGQASLDNQSPNAGLVAQIRETHKLRQDLHRAEKSLTLQIKAIERRLGEAAMLMSPMTKLPPHPSRGEGHMPSDAQYVDADAAPNSEEVPSPSDAHKDSDNLAFFATLPLQEARAVIKKGRTKAERQMQKLAKQLPAYAWVEQIHGMGALGFAQIIGEAGDLSNYANPGKLWKRMGLAVLNGEAQGRRAGAAAIEQGYSPVRRSIMYCIGDSMIKKQNAYRELYLQRKVTEEQKLPDGTKQQWHRRAQRYMEKRLLRDLWRAWRDTDHEKEV